MFLCHSPSLLNILRYLSLFYDLAVHDRSVGKQENIVGSKSSQGGRVHLEIVQDSILLLRVHIRKTRIHIQKKRVERLRLVLLVFFSGSNRSLKTLTLIHLVCSRKNIFCLYGDTVEKLG